MSPGRESDNTNKMFELDKETEEIMGQVVHMLKTDFVPFTLEEEMARLQNKKSALEETTLKKLQEMEFALRMASTQVDRANAAVQRLEIENAKLRQKMEAARVRSEHSAVSLQEETMKDMMTWKNFQSWENLLEEHTAERRKLPQIRQQFEQAKELYDQLEVIETLDPGESALTNIPEKPSSIKLEEKNGADKKMQESRLQPGELKEDTNNTYTKYVTVFSYSDLQLATSGFSKLNKLGQGGFGEVYKGNLRGNEVAIKILLNAGDLYQQKAFNQEVKILCNLNHPHLVRLIGACPEKYALVYEFIPGGTLEDRLRSKDFTWHDRICIAIEICYALMYLHSLKPNFVVHGDLKPENILLDANGKSKLGDFGICQLIPTSKTTATAHVTAAIVQGSAGYMDPLFIQSGRCTPKNDVYAFGMVLLRLLTKKKAGIALIEEVEEAIENQRLDEVLDTAAKWPFYLAEELASLAKRCCSYGKRGRPNLENEVSKKLELMKEESSA